MTPRLTHFFDDVQDRLMLLGETVLEHLPRMTVPNEKFRDLRVICHRGARTSGEDGIRENTLAAFDRALDLGAWGIEFDVRFTADGVPVVHHDEHTERVFGARRIIEETSAASLRANLPLLPTLEEVLARYQGRAHLMIELKTMLTPHQRETLRALMRPFEPARDFHFMSLKSARLKQVQFAPPEALLPVAELNVPWLSREALREGWAGLSGQYFLIGPKMIAQHQKARQKVGTGFVNTVAALTRELSRNVDWIFTDRPDAVLKHAGEIRRQLAQPTVGHIG